jgi:hypothetical protein
MPAFFEYLRNITYYLLFTALVGHIAPGGKHRKYVLLVAGLILVCMLLRPLAMLSTGGIPVTELFAGLTSASAKYTGGNANTAKSALVNEAESSAGNNDSAYEAWRYETVEAAFTQQLETQLSALLSGHGYTLEEASFEYAEDFSALISVTAQLLAGNKAEARPFIYIEPVRIQAYGNMIDGNAEGEPAENDPAAEAVKKLISDFYNVPLPHIYIKIIRE